MTEVVLRPAARVVILDPDDGILLQRIATNGWDGWITPGGAIEEGETPSDAAARELIEEVGLRDMTLGPVIWTRAHTFPWKGVTYDQREVFFFARLDERIEPVPTVSGAELFADGVLEHRWWMLDDLSGVMTAPRNLVALVRELIESGPPSSPIDVGV